MTPARSYFIAATPRSGSSLLSEALDFTLIAGHPREYFEPTYEKEWYERFGVTTEAEYFPRFLAGGSSPNGTFGAKIHWHQFLHLRSKLDLPSRITAADREALNQTFPNLKFVLLTRADKVLQGVSYARALQTDLWHSLGDGTGTVSLAPAPEPQFDFDAIDRWVTRFKEDEARWRRYLELLDIEPFEVVYEDFLKNYEPTVRQIVRYLEIPTPGPVTVFAPRLRKLGDEISDDWASLYRATKWKTRPLRSVLAQSYFLATSPRTGGFLLAEALGSTGIAGNPQEYFDPRFQREWSTARSINSDTAYLESIFTAGATPNQVFGAKVLWHQFEHWLERFQLLHGHSLSDREFLDRTFPGLRYVFLTRRDKVRQAVSYVRAIRSGIWWSIASDATENPPADPPPFDFAQIDGWVKRLTRFEANWRRHFARIGVTPFEVAYEELAESLDATTRAVLYYLELPIPDDQPLPPPRLQRQADDVTEDWVVRYHELKSQS